MMSRWLGNHAEPCEGIRRNKLQRRKQKPTKETKDKEEKGKGRGGGGELSVKRERGPGTERMVETEERTLQEHERRRDSTVLQK